MGNGYRVVRVPVAAEPLLDGATHDYADCFEVRLHRADTHTAEQWARACVTSSPGAVLALIRLVHGRIARFDLAADDADHLMGWRVTHSSQDAFQLQAGGPLLRAHIVARRTSPTTNRLTTSLLYERPAAARLWRVIGPLHRVIAPLLLRRAAAALAASEQAGS